MLRLSRTLRRDPGAWRAGLLTGLGTSTFSSVMVGLGARFIGRSARVDWMELGTILLRARAPSERPRLPAMAAGLAVHQGADILWAAVWGRLAATLPARARQPATVAAWLPWSAATAWVEYTLILPWLQPLVRMSTPYWTATLVHALSGAAYPVLPVVRSALAGREEPGARSGRRAAAGLVGAAMGLAAFRALAEGGREPAWPGLPTERRAEDRWFLRTMHRHHEAGLELSELAARRSSQRDLRVLGRLMAAEHAAQLRLMRSWWRGWYGGDLPAPTAEDRARMGGMPAEEDMQRLRREEGGVFDRLFCDLMIPHHEGGIVMARELLRTGGDPRLKLLCLAIDHSQVGQVARMRALCP